ncbi:MAG: HEPN domain-containing protein [Ginsengibacter sp.]
MKKSAALLSEVDILFINKFYDTLINRLYYSCLHATRGLLLTQDLVSKTHSGVVTLLNQKFVMEGKFDVSHVHFIKT